MGVDGLVKFLSYADSNIITKNSHTISSMKLTRAFSPGPRADKNPTPRVAPPTMPACPSRDERRDEMMTTQRNGGALHVALLDGN